MNGLIAFLVVVVLFVAVMLLYRSMTRHLRRIPPSFDPPAEARPSTPRRADR